MTDAVVERIPMWLRPSMNVWCAAGTLEKYFLLDGRPPASFVHRLRAKHVTLGAKLTGDVGPKGPVVHYLVKRVAIAGRAYGCSLDEPRAERTMTPSQLRIVCQLRDSLAAATAECARLQAERGNVRACISRAKQAEQAFHKEVLGAIAEFPRERNVRGVYFVFDGDEVVYVGSANNVAERLSHPAAAAQVVRVLPVGDGADHRAVESAFIRALRPRLNRRDNPSARKLTANVSDA